MLSLNIYRVNDLQWGRRMELRNGVLTVDREALAAHLLSQDPRLAAVHFDIAHPGELCRIMSIFDVVEPRARGDGGSDFPGVLGRIDTAGSGALRVLRGAAVTILDPTERGGALLDMGGKHEEGWTAQDLSALASVHHLVLIPHLAEGVKGDEAANTLRLAVLRAAVWLADQTAIGQPDDEECYQLQPAPGLPRIVYVFQIHSHQRPTVTGEPLLYGDNARHLLPVLLHPNEVLGGAVVQGYGSRGTYILQNHPVILELYRRHGVDLDFTGVIVVVAHQTAEERERGVVIAAHMVKDVLRADGAIFTKTGGGAPHVDMAEMAHRCERLGVRTSLIAWETSSAGSPEDGSALFNHPDLDAVVNVGSNGYNFSLPTMDRVIAPWGDAAALDRARAPMRVTAGQPVGVLEQFGGGRWTMVLY